MAYFRPLLLGMALVRCEYLALSGKIDANEHFTYAGYLVGKQRRTKL
jgi:hypothetical protein